MDIRVAYATIMIRRHFRRNSDASDNLFSFREMSEDELLSMLACVMNTATEQIRQVYAASSHQEYTVYVARIMNICR